MSINSSFMQLVFHPVSDESKGRISTVFADAAKRVLDAAPGSEVRIVGPYIGHGILTQLVTGRDFRLLTDCDACFESAADKSLVDFFERNSRFVRHLPRVHAKVVCTDAAALIGSANVTQSGFANRDEMGCLIFDPPMVCEILEWFDGLWNASR